MSRGQSRFDVSIFKLMLLMIPFFGALSPVFRQDEIAKYVGAASVVILTALAARAVFPRTRRIVEMGK